MAKNITLLDVILKLPDIASEFRGDKVELENGYLTIVTDVSAVLAPHTDFEFNGTIIASDTRAKVIEAYGSKPLSQLCDFTDKNMKICWSGEKIIPTDEHAIFQPNLVIRLLNQDPSSGVVNFIVLKNKYGSSLVSNSYQVINP